MSVIVINYNGAEHLRHCLPSLARQTYRWLEVLVVDNGSADESAQVAAEFPVRWEPLGKNYGFALGNNLGARRAQGEILLFVNNDMRFPADFVERLAAPLVADGSVFATDAKQLNWDGGRELHLATRLVPVPRRRLLRDTRPIFPGLDIEQYPVAEEIDVLFASAANLAVRRSMFEELGGFDRRYPIGWEDTDICWRAWLRGWRTRYIPAAFCWHHLSMSAVSEAGAAFRFRGSVGGRLLFAAKLLPGTEAATIWGLAVAGVLRHAARLQFKEAGKRLNVLGEFLRLLPAAWLERSRMFGAAGTSPRRHLERLRNLGREAAVATSAGCAP